MKMKLTFKTVYEDKEVELAVLHPTVEQRNVGQIEYNKAFSAALANGSLLRLKLDQYMKDQGLWNDKKQQEYEKLNKDIRDAEIKLEKGGIKKSVAKDICIQLIKDRGSLRELISERSALDNVTVEGQADNARFNYYVSACTVYNDTGKPFFKDLKDYLNRGLEPATIEAASNLMGLLYGIDSDFESKLPENKFLQKFHYVDEKLRFINEDGHLVDINGRLVDEDGRFVNEAGEYVDADGNLVDYDGNLSGEPLPFLDDEGKPIVEEESKELTKTE